MLLSTDWFLPYWSAIQIEVAEGTKRFVQQRCREITKHFIGDAEEYYHISFAQNRLDETTADFLALFAEANFPTKTAEHVRQLMAIDHDSNTARWMITMTTKMLVTGHRDLPAGKPIPQLAPETVSVLAEWNKRQPAWFDFGRLCLNSTSEWDKYISALTPRTPAALESYLQAGLITEIKFRDLRATFGSMTDAEKKNLREWYVEVSRKLTGADHVNDGIAAALKD